MYTHTYMQPHPHMHSTHTHMHTTHTSTCTAHKHTPHTYHTHTPCAWHTHSHVHPTPTHMWSAHTTFIGYTHNTCAAQTPLVQSTDTTGTAHIPHTACIPHSHLYIYTPIDAHYMCSTHTTCTARIPPHTHVYTTYIPTCTSHTHHVHGTHVHHMHYIHTPHAQHVNMHMRSMYTCTCAAHTPTCTPHTLTCIAHTHATYVSQTPQAFSSPGIGPKHRQFFSCQPDALLIDLTFDYIYSDTLSLGSACLSGYPSIGFWAISRVIEFYNPRPKAMTEWASAFSQAYHSASGPMVCVVLGWVSI